ncbi:Primase C terminal 2 (PriCT-2) [Arachidicoccus rhizosphaerae]|uniref:Primase C terminal 2 (PriCT-2) n=1 Tax=Arachidicoccus rhizosphaerae TaxID=551991 RepID=A0A1H4CGI7_9BACT|nr:VapE domain-containing protein [Arachidicoccus rhizosphaerae]SEA59536.1 Primase C terminal 2 (PriCT-2) [Arachidicoccus rhizosphaerae]
MQTPNISIYSLAKEVAEKETIPLDMFLDKVQDGYWQDIVSPIRVLPTKEQRADLKKRTAPAVTISGQFERRASNALVKHSGFIAIDIDGLEGPGELNAVRAMVEKDPHVYASFASISGRGLCLLFKITPGKHKESFMGISDYMYNTYNVIVDASGSDVSRLRFVSFDPALFRNETALKWTKYPKTREPKKLDKVIYAHNDFEEILKEIDRRGISLCDGYEEWLRIGFAFADQFGEGGRNYFRHVSQYSYKFNERTCEKQYDNCLKAHGAGRKATIATFYYYCKQAGIEVYSQRTKTIAYSASQGKKGGLNAQQVAKNLAQFEGIQGDDVQQIAQSVMDNNIQLNEDGPIEQLELWLRQNYDLRRNEITRMVEDGGFKIEEKELNSIWIKANKVLGKTSFDTLKRLIGSDFVADYNPFKEFVTQNIERGKDGGHIKKLLSSIETPDPEYLQYFGTKWIVSIISAIFDQPSDLDLILVGGEHGTGKTYWFNHLLPEGLTSYFAQSNLDEAKDGEILMTKKLIILDDEMGGKSKKDSKRFKTLTSQRIFSIREPYGMVHRDLRRLAVLCGSSNEDDVIDDPTGNRRKIPILLTGINHNIFNDVDKTDVFMEAYHLWKSGFDWKVLSKEDKAYLNKHIAQFEAVSNERELIQLMFENGPVEMPASEIESKIRGRFGVTRLTVKRIGMELKRLGFEQRVVWKAGAAQRVWMVQEISILSSTTSTEPPPFPPYEPAKPKQPVQQQIFFNPDNNSRNEYYQ